MVLMVHVSETVRGLPTWAANLTFYGVRGVQLFFIVSGLTLALAHKDRPLELANFAARRFFRVAPMFYVGAALYLSLAAWSRLTLFMPKNVTVAEVVQTILFVHGWSIDANNKIVPGGWSIAAEAMFYFCFPLLLMQLRKPFLPLLLGLYVLAGVTNIALKTFVDPGFAFGFWIVHLPAFATGVWFATSFGYDRASKSMGKAIASICVGALVLDSQLRGHSNLLVAIVLLAAFVWSVGKWRPALLESRVLTWIGNISFSLYILHFAILSSLSFYAPQLGQLAWPVSFSVIYFLTLFITGAIASLTFLWIEKPLIRVGRQLFKPGARGFGSFRHANMHTAARSDSDKANGPA